MAAAPAPPVMNRVFHATALPPVAVTVPSSTASFVSIAAGAVLVAVSCLLVPLRGIQRRIANTKRMQLSEVCGRMCEAEAVVDSIAGAR